jgi:hypothetical protein
MNCPGITAAWQIERQKCPIRVGEIYNDPLHELRQFAYQGGYGAYLINPRQGWAF